MGLQNKPHRRSTKGTECKSLCNDNKKRRSTKPIVRQTTKHWFNCGIKVKICGTML